MRHTGAVGVGRMPSVQPQLEIRLQHLWVVGDDRHRHVVVGAESRDEMGGLVVAEHDQHQVLVAVVLDEREQRLQRVHDRVGVSQLGVAAPGLVDRQRLEDGAVADLVPRDQRRDAGPREVAGHGVDLGEQGLPVGLSQLQALQGEVGVLVGHGCVRVRRAVVADVVAVVDLVVVVEGLAARPGVVVRRHVVDDPPAGPFEGEAEREPVAGHQLVVATREVDPGTRLHRRVGQPADPAEGGRGQPAAPGTEAGRVQLLRPAVQDGVHLRGVRRPLDRHLAVALDEDQQHVLAAQSGQQPVAGRRGVRVMADLGGEDRLIVEVGLHRPHLLHDKVGRAHGGKRHPGDDLGAQSPAHQPGAAERDDDAARPQPVAGRNAHRAPQRQRRNHDRRDDQQHQSHLDQIGARAADRLAQRLGRQSTSSPSPQRG